MELVTIVTTGDRIQDRALSAVGGKGLFVKEIETALLNGEIDLAVHSAKDLPAEEVGGLVIGAVTRRGDPRDAVVSRDDLPLDRLPRGAKVGTSSLRRAAQLRHYRPDLEIIPVRGNVDTRLGKLEAMELDAVILAAAGLQRLGLGRRVAEFLSPAICLPAVGQGALAIQIRAEDGEVAGRLAPLNHGPTATAVTAERAFLEELEGSCQVPIGALATLEGDALALEGVLADGDGGRLVRDRIAGSAAAAGDLGRRLARSVLTRGGAAILADLKKGGTSQ